MSVLNDSTEPQYGNMVAVEGNADLVATQLRLLPPSSKILILPALSTALPSVSAEPFEARRWIHHVHHAFKVRSETARFFLQSSTSMQPRLVFVNGGSVGARVECICRIAEQLTNGRIDEAEAIFNDIVKDGVAGILRPDQADEEASKIASIDFENEGHSQPKNLAKPQDYRGAVAMEAADRLDRQTADLLAGPKSSTPSLKRSILSHVLGAKGGKELPDLPGDHIKRTVIIIPDELEDRSVALIDNKRGTFGVLPATTYTPDLRKSSIVSQESLYEDEEGEEALSYNGDRYETTPGLIEVGHAQVIRVESAHNSRNMRSVKSADRLTTDKITTRRRSRSLTPKLISTRAIAHRTAALKGFGDGRRASLSDLEKAPETAFVRAYPTTIKIPSSKSSSKASSPTDSFKTPGPIYVDRGTSARSSIYIPGERPSLTLNTDAARQDAIPFEPVFPVVEDLVIHFTDGAENSPIESVVRSYKNGSYPVFPTPTPDSHYSQTSSPQSYNSHQRLRHSSQWTAETDDTGYHRRHESNPYNADNVPTEPGQKWWPQRKGTRIENPAISTSAPLSPAATPPPIRTGIAHRFHRFSPINSKTATGIQNSLRAVLNVHYPPELTNYRQYSDPVDSDRLWKPVFRDSDGSSQEGRTVDQIIAIGAEDGVKGTFFNEIAGQVERLGTKKNGTTRSGKLDMRFLIASAMQTFTKQSLSYQSQSSSSPFSSPMLLASLLVPQVEIYLASNVSVRLLIIHYSASHLPTILALRHLIGADTFTIAGVLDSNFKSSDPSNSSSPFTHLIGNRLSNANVAAYNSRSRTPGSASGSLRSTKHSPSQSIEFKHNDSEPIRTSFSRANYLLQSTALDAEISTFLSKITSNLIEKSSYYTPEPILTSTRKISGSLHSPLSSNFPTNSTNTSSAWKSMNPPTTPTSNSSRPMTPQTREREHRVGQSLNNNIMRPSSNLNNYASSTKSTFTNLSLSKNRGVNASRSPTPHSPNSTTSFIPIPTRHFSPTASIASTSSAYSAHNRPYSPISTSHSISTNTIFNTTSSIHSHSNSNTTLHPQSIHPTEMFTTTNNNNNTNRPITPTATTILGPRPNTGSSRPNTAARDMEARERQSERDWANFYLGDSDEDDEIDRILMPRVVRRGERRKGNSRKALKWLGLA